jgi:hypothetical protein
MEAGARKETSLCFRVHLFTNLAWMDDLAWMDNLFTACLDGRRCFRVFHLGSVPIRLLPAIVSDIREVKIWGARELYQLFGQELTQKRPAAEFINGVQTRADMGTHVASAHVVKSAQ